MRQMTVPNITRQRQWWPPVAAVLVLVAVTTAAYWPVFQAGFVWDDDYWLTNNFVITRGHAPWGYWYPRVPMLDYLPLTGTALWVQHELWGDEALGYHVVNLILHIASALLLWRILRRLGTGAPWLAALIFAVHPVAVASAAWIAEVKNTLSMFLAAAAVLAYLRFDDSDKRRWHVLSIALFALGLLAKTSIVIVPLILLGCVWFKHRRITLRDWLRAAPLFILSLVMGLVTIKFQSGQRMDPPVEGPAHLAESFMLAGKALWFYLYKALAPLEVCMIYPRWDPHRVGLWDMTPLLGVGVSALLIWRLPKGVRRPIAFALGYYVLALLPVLGFVTMSFMGFSFVADHWHYLALIAPIALVVHLVHRVVRGRRTLRIGACVVAAAVIAGLSVVTYHQAAVYENRETLWRDTIAKNPDAWGAHNDIGVELANSGRFTEALHHYGEVIRIRPDHHVAYRCMGDLYMRLGRLEDARKSLLEAYRLRPRHPETNYHLAAYYEQTHQSRLAVEHYRKAIISRPNWPFPINNLAWLLATDPDPAVRDPNEAIRLAAALVSNPKHRKIEMVMTLAAAYSEARRHDEAVRTTRMALALARAQGRTEMFGPLQRLIEAYSRGLSCREYMEYNERMEAESKRRQSWGVPRQ